MAKLLSRSTLLALSASALISVPVSAEVREGAEIGAGIGAFNFENDIPIEDEEGLKVHGGYRFDNPWGVELSYAEISAAVPGDDDGDISQLTLNLLYHFNSGGSYEPYLAAGLGRFDVNSNLTDEDRSVAGLGAGIKFHLNDKLTLRPDFFYADADGLDDRHLLSSLTLSYFFGDTTPAEPPAPKVVDTDGDGVEDGRDACPNTVAGAPVDARGCALDSDSDGVADYLDECPNTIAKLKVDSKGCPVELTESVSINLEVNFDTNSAEVKPRYYDEIRRVADFMAQYENSVVEIEGHTDTRGSASYNKQLSQRRADAVAAVLVNQMGVASNRVTAVGYGEEQPIAEETTPSGLETNRRVVATVSAEKTTLQER